MQYNFITMNFITTASTQHHVQGSSSQLKTIHRCCYNPFPRTISQHSNMNSSSAKSRSKGCLSWRVARKYEHNLIPELSQQFKSLNCCQLLSSQEIYSIFHHRHQDATPVSHHRNILQRLNRSLRSCL